MDNKGRTLEEAKRSLQERGVELVADLGTDIYVAQVPINELREQDINARIMDDAKFKQLVNNIKKRGMVESLPFCAYTEKGIEIVSGHHRVKASREAGYGEEDMEWVHLTKIFGGGAIPKEYADVISEAVKKMEKKGEINEKKKWEAIASWAAKYLDENR